MKTYFYFLLLITIIIPACNKPKPQDIIPDGFEAYRIKGVDSAIAVWTSSWSKEYTDSKNQLINDFVANEKNYGKFNGYDVVEKISVGNKYRYYYITILYEVRPVFALFTVYNNSADQWVVLSIALNTDIKEVFPKEIYME
jgi:hypothetical protein